MNTDRIQRLQSLLGRIKHNAALPKQALGKGFVLSGTAAPRSDVSAGPAVPAAVQQHSATPTRTGMPAQQPYTAQPAQPAPVPQMRSIKMTQPMQLTPVQSTPASPPAAAAPQARLDQTPVFGRSAEPTAQAPQPSAPVRAAPSAPAHPAPSAPVHAQPAPSAPQAAQPWTPARPAPSAPVNVPPAAAAQSAQPPATTSTSSATMQAVHSPLVAVPSVTATMVDGRRVRARVPTVIGVAPSPASPKQPEGPPPAREPAPSVTIEELDADEVLDAVSSLPPPPEPAAADGAKQQALDDKAAKRESRVSQPEIDNLTWSEPPIDVEQPPPDSSRRTRAAGSIDEALAEAAADSEHEVPVKTPPPESGRQPAEGVYAAPMQNPAVPTPEQLGDTLELEEPTAAELELDLTHRKPERVPEELEVDLPKQPSVLEPVNAPEPPHRAPEPSQVVEIPEEADTAIMPGSSRRDLLDREALELQPEVTRRRAAEKPAAIELLQSARAFAPRSFLELLDASLKLGGK